MSEAEHAINGDLEELTADEVLNGTDSENDDVVLEAINSTPHADSRPQAKALIEAVIYITDEPLTAEQIATALRRPIEEVQEVLSQLVSEYSAPDRGLSVRELAGGYKISTKAEHHESIRQFVKNLQPPFKLSQAALETLAVIAYKQPITAPEIMELRGVQGAGVLKTLLDRKLIAAGGRKNIIGKPILYRTTREFLVEFGLSSLAELPTLKEFEELGRLALTEGEEIIMGRETDEIGKATVNETRPNEADEIRPADLVNPEAVSYGNPEGESSPESKD